jgi:hypothetical protein
MNLVEIMYIGAKEPSPFYPWRYYYTVRVEARPNMPTVIMRAILNTVLRPAVVVDLLFLGPTRDSSVLFEARMRQEDRRDDQ